MNLTAFARQAHISRNTARRRIADGWSLEKIRSFYRQAKYYRSRDVEVSNRDPEMTEKLQGLKNFIERELKKPVRQYLDEIIVNYKRDKHIIAAILGLSVWETDIFVRKFSPHHVFDENS